MRLLQRIESALTTFSESAAGVALSPLRGRRSIEADLARRVFRVVRGRTVDLGSSRLAPNRVQLFAPLALCERVGDGRDEVCVVASTLIRQWAMGEHVRLAGPVEIEWIRDPLANGSRPQITTSFHEDRMGNSSPPIWLTEQSAGAPRWGRLRWSGGQVEFGGAPVIGRGESCCLRVADPRVSRRQAQLLRVKQDISLVVDLGSKNGTQLRGEPVAEMSRIRDGDVLSLGGLDFVFESHRTSE